ncbi:proteasome subunit alpha type-5 [Tanacetum coccineum]
MASMNTRLNIKMLDVNIVQKHGGSKQVGLKKLGSKQVRFKQLGHKQVGFKQLGHKQVGFKQLGSMLKQESMKYSCSKRLEDKQLEENTNTDYLVKEQENVHLGIKVGANITVTRVPGQEGAEGNVVEKKKVKESKKANLGKLLKYNAWSTRWSLIRGLVHTPLSTTLYVPPTKNDWDLLFQPMFDEYFNPLLSDSSVSVVAAPRPADLTKPLQPAQLVDDPFLHILTSEPSSQESSSSVQRRHKNPLDTLMVIFLLPGINMNRSFLDSGGRNNNYRKKSNTDSGNGLSTESDGIAKENTSLGSYPPLPTRGTTLAGNTPGKSSYANVTGAPIDVGNVLVWVKLHGVPVITFSEDGLSAIATKLGTPLMLDFYTSNMCLQSWGRSSYARAMIELRADVELKDTIMMAMPKLSREGLGAAKILTKPNQALRGVSAGPKVGFKLVKEYRHVSKKLTANTSDEELGTNGGTSNLASNGANSSGTLFWNVETSSTSTTPIVDKIGKLDKLIIEGIVTLVADVGKPIKKETVGFCTKSMLEQWTDSYGNGDYDEDPYDDDMYEDQDLPDKLQDICDNLDIINFKEALLESSWIDAMQEEIHEFERLDVWELVPCPDLAMIIKLKWIFKVKQERI